MAAGNETPRSKHIPVHIDAATYASLDSYSQITGIPRNRVAAEAIKDWMETIGAARLEALTATSHPDSAPVKLFRMRAAGAGATQEVIASV